MPPFVHREDGDLKVVDHATQACLPFGVRRVISRKLPQIEESAFQHPLRAWRVRNERVHFTDQHLNVGGVRQEGHASGGARAVRVGRVERGQ